MSRLAKLLCSIFVFMNMTIEAQAEVQRPTMPFKQDSIEVFNNSSNLFTRDQLNEDLLLKESLLDNILANNNDILLLKESLLDNILANNNDILLLKKNLLFPIETQEEDIIEENNIEDQEDDLMPYGQVVNVTSNVCMRESANKESNVIYGLYKGMTFKILDKTKEWYYIQHNNNKGYIHEEFVEEYEKDPPHEVYVAPKPKVIQQSSSNYAQSNGRAIKAELTAYCNCSKCSDHWHSKTAMGTTTRLGVIAVPKTIPLGSKVYIPHLKFLKSDGIFSAEDRGGAIKVKSDGTHVIDVWFPSHSQALKFGRVKTTIYLMD